MLNILDKKINQGFTLIELLVVVAIIGVLVVIVTGSLRDARNEAIDVRMLTKAKELQKAAETYNLFEGTFPTAGSIIVWNDEPYASSCTHPSNPDPRTNWETMVNQMGDYLPTSFTEEDGDWPYCIIYRPTTHPNCPDQSPAGYNIIFGTIDGAFNNIDQYVNIWATQFNCIYPV